MSDLRTAAQQALEAYDAHEPMAVVIETLRAALAEPLYEPVQVCWLSKLQPDAYLPNGELNPKYLQPASAAPVQEPVAWIYADPDKPGLKFLEWREDAFGYEGEWIKTPLYAAPPQSKP